jgi:D-aspartate ligase
LTDDRAVTESGVDTSTPVVVLQLAADNYPHGRLGVLRTLGRMGATVSLVQRDRLGLARFSRYCDGCAVHDPTSAAPGETMELLASIGSSAAKRPVLMATDDVGTLFVEDNAAALGEHFCFPDQPKGLARTLANKRELYLMCVDQGVDAPDTVFPRSREEVEGLAATTTYPVVVKSMDPVLLSQRPEASSVTIVVDSDELLRAYEVMESPEEPNLMFQQYIPGGPLWSWIFNGYLDARSECLFGRTGRKVRQDPPGTGAASLAETAPNEEVDTAARRFLKGIGYQGIVDMGFRFDERDGRYKLFDVNPRIGASFRTFVGADGMDVARALYLDLTGQPVPRSPSFSHRRWLNEPSDVSAGLAYRREGALSLRQWISSLRGVEEAAWLARDDPLPFGAMVARFVARRARRAATAWWRRPGAEAPEGRG